MDPTGKSADATVHLPGLLVPICGVGASAGGLEAICDLLEHLPGNTGLAYLIVSHMAPEHESLLSSILSKRTALPVAEATDGMAVAPDRVYVIPPGKVMTVANARLHLVAREAASAQHAPINALFCSMAARGGLNIGVVLSGTGSDGAEGVKAIKETAGIVLAQDPASSRFAAMPESAIQTGC
jgi:two-component system CheB/CheR fusion protein